MKENSDSIYGCGHADVEKPEYGRVTAKGRHLYYHVNEPQIGFVPLKGIAADEVESIRLLATGSELQIARNWMTNNYPDVVFVKLGARAELPDPVDTVIDVKRK